MDHARLAMRVPPSLRLVARALAALPLLLLLTACPMDSLLHPDLPRFTELPAFDPLILPLQFRTRSIRNVAPVDQVERGVTAQPVAA